MTSYSDKLLNTFDQAAKDWGVQAEHGVDDRKVMRTRRKFLAARKALQDYMQGLERSLDEARTEPNDRLLNQHD